MGVAHIQVDQSNAAQLAAWDGQDGSYWAARADRFDEGVAAYLEPFFVAAAIEPEDYVLDIGCGSGQMTREAGRRASIGSALGVDLSARQIEVAEQLAAARSLPNVRFLQADAQIYPLPQQSFDISISRHGAMFFGDPVAAFRNIHRALRPGGRLVLLTWQPTQSNPWMSEFRDAFTPAGADQQQRPGTAARPGSLTDPDQIRDLLTSSGFKNVRVEGLRQPMFFGHDVDDAGEFIKGQFAWMLDNLDEQSRIQAIDTLRAGLAGHLTDDGICYDSCTWLIEATAAS